MSRPIIVGGVDVTEHVRRALAQAPPPSAQQIAQLTLLFAPPMADSTITAVRPRMSARLRADQAA